ncbi:hypothetical protein [Azospirillum sp. TSO5]|uniref:hypothetical protein n=1 Tax=Azospirillum sp. TSO5 TaxID=716760 RepID=UPI000D610B2D|nr:hypothetical protein [Azospirillum sp. TSO5]PWC98015.1 hypothetical protein TSO5_03530 [Azospirillum sp. TSO5]
MSNSTLRAAARLFDAVATAAEYVGNGILRDDAKDRAAECRGEPTSRDALDGVFRDFFSSSRGR